MDLTTPSPTPAVDGAGGPATAAPPDAAAAAATPNPHRWWILATLATAQLMVTLDSTVVNIALPSAQHALGFTNADRQWVVTGYTLAFGSLLLISGRLGDRYGRRRLFLIGVSGFAVASAVGGAATNVQMLVGARVVQGIFAAVLAPATLSLLTTTFTDGRERARAFGVSGAVSGSGAAIGLMLGGFLTEYASWRWTLYVNLFFAAAALVGGTLWIRQVNSGYRPRLDWPGTITASAGLFLLVYGFSRAETSGWSEAKTLIVIAVAAALLLAFVAIQLTTAEPLLPLRLFADRNRAGAYVAIFTSAVGMFAMFVFLVYYLQVNQGYSAVQTGVAFLPMIAALVVSSTGVAAVLSGRVSPRILIPLGMVLSAAGLWILSGISLTTSYVTHTLPACILVGLGIGLVFATGTNLATFRVRTSDAGIASATVNALSQVGGSLGTALLNTVAAMAAANFAAAHVGTPNIASLAAVHSYTVTFKVSAAILAGGALLVALLLRSGLPFASGKPADPAVAV